jgi:hypothetical protein
LLCENFWFDLISVLVLLCMLLAFNQNDFTNRFHRAFAYASYQYFSVISQF